MLSRYTKKKDIEASGKIFPRLKEFVLAHSDKSYEQFETDLTSALEESLK
jgi:hypothetical protein